MTKEEIELKNKIEYEIESIMINNFYNKITDTFIKSIRNETNLTPQYVMLLIGNMMFEINEEFNEKWEKIENEK